MLKFFSASTSIVNSKRAITECLENALEGEPDLNCDLIIIYSAMGHNFSDLLSEAKKLSPLARIVGCTGGGIIGKEGPDESMKALAVMAIKGAEGELAVLCRAKNKNEDLYDYTLGMAQELKILNPKISMIQFIVSGETDFLPVEKSLDAVKSVFGKNTPIFGAVSMGSMSNLKNPDSGPKSFQFNDLQVCTQACIMIGYADPTLKFICHSNHGFGVIEGMSFEVTKSESNIVYEFNNRPAWKLLTDTLGVPETIPWLEVLTIAGFARELPESLREEYGSNFILFVIMGKTEDDGIIMPVACEKGMRIWLTRRDEKKMFEGVDTISSKIGNGLKGKRPLAIFQSDCILRGRFSLNRILKEEIISHMQTPIFKEGIIPWLGLYSAGEISMLGGESWFQQISSSLFVIYR